jgi:hypothetical protein
MMRDEMINTDSSQGRNRSWPASSGPGGERGAPLSPRTPLPTTAAAPRRGSAGHFGLLSLSAVQPRSHLLAHSSEKSTENGPAAGWRFAD